MNKTKVGIIFGGTNTEHEVSIVSAKSIINHLDKKRYQEIPIKISKKNTWKIDSKRVDPIKALNKVDIAFPVLHGPNGEDGTIQGLFETINIPYVGCNVLSSAVCMDKVIQKQICQAYKIPVPKYYWFTKHDWVNNQKEIIKNIKKSILFPNFVKPANQGSSVGVNKTKNESQLKKSIKYSLKYDHKIIVEQAIKNPREIEVSLLGNQDPKTSLLGEIVPSSDFYDYDAKYIDGKSKEIIPAKTNKSTKLSIQETALTAFKALNCSGLARADFILDGKTNKYYLNELNTMPGFTSISMYPKLWQKSGLPYQDLLHQLIKLGFESHRQKSQINLSYKPKTRWYNN